MIREIEKKLPDPYKLIGICLFILVVVNFSQFGIAAFISVGIALACAVCVDCAITYLRIRKFVFSNTSAISALIISLIISPANPMLVATCAAAAMVLKHVLRSDGAPIFNPATLGMFVVLSFLDSTPSSELWWGNYNFLAVALLGILVSARIKRLAASFSYLALYTLISIARYGLEPALKFFPFFSAFFMLVEPKTSPPSTKAQVIFGLLIAILGHAFLMFKVSHGFFIAILIGNLVSSLFLKKLQ